MAETMIIKIANLATIVYGVAYMNLETGMVRVYRDGTPLLAVETMTSAVDSLALAAADDVLRENGWSATCDWDRPSAEWTEYRCEVLSIARTDAATPVPAGWDKV
jgi:hypothetical protein